MQKEHDVVVREPGVAFRHFFAHEQLDAGIECIDLSIGPNDPRLLGMRGIMAEDEPDDDQCARRPAAPTGPPENDFL